jgi:hypothetical protein
LSTHNETGRLRAACFACGFPAGRIRIGADADRRLGGQSLGHGKR